MVRGGTLIILYLMGFYMGIVNHSMAQPKNNEYNVLNLNIAYGAYLPAGDWQKRFGFHFGIGGGLEYISYPGNVIIGVESIYNFGGIVKEDVLRNLETVDGQLIGANIEFGNVELRERGQFTGLTLGKIFPTHPTNRREGIRVSMSMGYLWHKIRIQDDFSTMAQLTGDYRKGYDRLTGGFAMSQYIGYQKIDRGRKINYIVGLELMQGFTRSIRDWNFDSGPADKSRKIDLAFGVKLAWFLPFYVGMPASDIYY